MITTTKTDIIKPSAPTADELAWCSGALILAACLATACGGSGGDAITGPEATHPCVSWCGTVAPWPHDGNPYQSDHYTVYSDGASLDARMQLAAIAEEVMVELKILFQLPGNDMFTFPPGQTKVHLYTYKHRNPQEWGGQAWFGGFMIYSLDHPERSAAGLTALDSYSRLVKHELTHVIQGLVVGSPHSYSTHTWFEEGLAEYVSALNPQHNIHSLEDFEARVAEFGGHNPISIHDDRYPGGTTAGNRYFYPMFELTMRYLLDPRGLGRSPLDVRGVFLDMGAGAEFTDAFEANFDLPEATLEAEFFERLRAYLGGA